MVGTMDSCSAADNAPHEGSAVVLMDRAGRVLLQQRDDHHPPEGYGRWAIPGGRREGEETPRATALREFEEETGVRLQRLRFFATVGPDDAAGRPGWTLHLFFADDDVPEQEVACYEGLSFRYWHPHEAATLRMNPAARALLLRFLASDLYRGTLATKVPDRVGVAVLELDRWGRVLLQLRDDDLPPERWPGHWSLPGGIVEPGESPDAAALREFEEETGALLQDLRLFRVYRRGSDLPGLLVNTEHVYYVDADLDEALLEVNEGQAFRYFAPDAIADLATPPHARAILVDFFASPAYRALFH